MTLRYHIEYYGCSPVPSCQTDWSSAIGATFTAASGWNLQPTTVGYVSSPQNYWNDVALKVVEDTVNTRLYGIDYTFDSGDLACDGPSFAHDCSPVGTANNVWHREVNHLNDWAMRNQPNGSPWPTGDPCPNLGTSDCKRALVTHEMGHGLSLQHPVVDSQDFLCQSVRTIMDVDEFLSSCGTPSYTPRGVDVCLVNNVFYDPRAGYQYAGC